MTEEFPIERKKVLTAIFNVVSTRITPQLNGGGGRGGGMRVLYVLLTECSFVNDHRRTAKS